MVLYIALTVVYLYERSLHIVLLFFLLFLFCFILCNFFVVIISKPGRLFYSPLSSLHRPPSPNLSGGFVLTDISTNAKGWKGKSDCGQVIK